MYSSWPRSGYYEHHVSIVLYLVKSIFFSEWCPRYIYDWCGTSPPRDLHVLPHLDFISPRPRLNMYTYLIALVSSGLWTLSCHSALEWHSVGILPQIWPPLESGSPSITAANSRGGVLDMIDVLYTWKAIHGRHELLSTYSAYHSYRQHPSEGPLVSSTSGNSQSRVLDMSGVLYI